MAGKKKKCEIEGCLKGGKQQPSNVFRPIKGTDLQACGSCRHRLLTQEKPDTGLSQEWSTRNTANTKESRGAAVDGNCTFAAFLIDNLSSKEESSAFRRQGDVLCFLVPLQKQRFALTNHVACHICWVERR
jgi:hypothetical protein